MAQELQRLGPFGHGNRRPVLSAKGLELGGNLRPMGADGRHLAFNTLVRSAEGDERRLRAVAFNFADRRRELEENAWRPVEIAFELGMSKWSGPEGFELCVKDIRPAARRSVGPRRSRTRAARRRARADPSGAAPAAEPPA